MHIGIEIKKDVAYIAFVSGDQQNISASKELKIVIGGESVQYYIDFRNSLSMLFKEESISKVSMVEGNNDSSKMRTILEYMVKEICYVNDIILNTYSSTHLKKLKEKFDKTMSSNLRTYATNVNLHAYSENAFVTAWRFA